jgi:hypothetical protein
MLRIEIFAMMGRSMPWTIAQPGRETDPRFFPESGPPPSHKGEYLALGATMTRVRPLLLLPLLPVLALAACQTRREPLTGYDSPPPGILLDSNNFMRTLAIWPIFDLPSAGQNFYPTLNGQKLVEVTSDEGFYDYLTWSLAGWTGGYGNQIRGMPADTYVAGLVDDTGQSWGQSAPLPVTDNADPGAQWPAAIFANFDGKVGSWSIDPSTQDSDPSTVEITVTNLLDEDVTVQRCVITASGPTSCTPVGTVAGGADLNTVETVVASTATQYQGLIVQLASDPSQSYERDLIESNSLYIYGGCQIERIIVHGQRSLPPGAVTIYMGNLSYSTPLAMSSCYGYASPAPQTGVPGSSSGG